MPEVTIRQALQHVADHPMLETDELIQVPVWELVARELYEIANNPDAKVRGSMSRANTARKLIHERLVGRRRPGTRPASKAGIQVDYVDLTAGALEGGEDDARED